MLHQPPASLDSDHSRHRLNENGHRNSGFSHWKWWFSIVIGGYFKFIGGEICRVCVCVWSHGYKAIEMKQWCPPKSFFIFGYCFWNKNADVSNQTERLLQSFRIPIAGWSGMIHCIAKNGGHADICQVGYLKIRWSQWSPESTQQMGPVGGSKKSGPMDFRMVLVSQFSPLAFGPWSSFMVFFPQPRIYSTASTLVQKRRLHVEVKKNNIWFQHVPTLLIGYLLVYIRFHLVTSTHWFPFWFPTFGPRSVQDNG